MIQPPYLEVNNPVDNSKIKKEISLMIKASKKKHNIPLFGSDLNASFEISKDLSSLKAISLENDDTTPVNVNIGAPKKTTFKGSNPKIEKNVTKNTKEVKNNIKK